MKKKTHVRKTQRKHEKTVGLLYSEVRGEEKGEKTGPGNDEEAS